MIFEDLPTVPRSEELVDKAFSRAARAGRAKEGVDAQESMLQTASNILSDNLENVVTAWPDLGTVDPFYRELADAVLRKELPGETDDGEGAGLDRLRAALSEVTWASRKTHELGREYQGRLSGDPETARKLRKQGFARMADVVREVEDDLRVVADARDALRDLPDIRPDEPTIVVAGYPNVGKSSFVNAVTSADNEIAEYPFTTRGIDVGHVEPAATDSTDVSGPAARLRYQLVDTPGLLDRPADERNEIEQQAASAVRHLADAVVVVVDASITCGYPLDVQLELRDDIEREFDVPVLTVCNKADLSTDVDADHYMSVTADDGVGAVLEAAVAAVNHEPELPFETER